MSFGNVLKLDSSASNVISCGLHARLLKSVCTGGVVSATEDWRLHQKKKQQSTSSPILLRRNGLCDFFAWFLMETVFH